MAAEGAGDERKPLMDRLLDSVSERYRQEHGEIPPDEFLERARSEVIRRVASKDREQHRDIYDALADE